MRESRDTRSADEKLTAFEELAVLAGAGTDAHTTYEQVAEHYDRFRELWIRWVGSEAEQAMLEDLAATLSPGARVLDAGAGTGALARRVVEIQPDVQLTLLDLSPKMLGHASDLHVERVVGNVIDLPFPDDRFDIVVSAWVIETLPDPLAAVREYLRVLSPSGHLFYTFCSLPDGWFSRAGSALLRSAIRRGFAGEFLPEQRTPWHDCAHSHRIRFRGGLTTEVALRKCCSISEPILPTLGDTRGTEGR